jgi:hypothetical protein
MGNVVVISRQLERLTKQNVLHKMTIFHNLAMEVYSICENYLSESFNTVTMLHTQTFRREDRRHCIRVCVFHGQFKYSLSEYVGLFIVFALGSELAVCCAPWYLRRIILFL